MKKLNNGGWGLATMIGFLCVLILFLLIASILAYRQGIEKESPESIYEQDVPDPSNSLVK